MCIFSNIVKPSCISAAPEICVSTIFGLIGLAAVDDVDQLGDLDVAGLGVDLDLGAGAGDHPERRHVRASGRCRVRAACSPACRCRCR